MSSGVRHRLWIAGKWQESPLVRDVRSPYTGEIVARVHDATPEQMGDAIGAAAKAFETYRRVSRATRSKLLEAMRDGIGARRRELVERMVAEAGKPVALAEAELARALTTFTVAAEETKRFGGDIVPVDVEASARPYGPALSYWVARGPVLGITPFNFPLNLVAHKVAPALAAGCSILIKPAPQAPGPAALLAAIFEKAAEQVSDSRESVPAAAFQVASCANDVASIAVQDPRIATVTFTGSTKVGWSIQSRALGKKVALELGGNAGVIVHDDADLERAAARCAFGGYAYAGQSCISVQRIFVQQSVAKRFEALLVAETAKVRSGDPWSSETLVGPLIDSHAAERVSAWIEEAKRAGARVLAGGSRSGNVVEPTVLAGVGPTQKVVCEEVFGPVVVVDTYDSFDEAIDKVNDSRFGLQAGVFTDSAKRIRQAVDRLEVGGVIINEVPTYRADPMPYGGVKESGIGREGVRYAMEEYSERRTVVEWHG